MAYLAAKRRRQSKNNEDTEDSDSPTSAAAAQQEGDVRQSALPPSVNVAPPAAPPEGAAVWTFTATPPTGGPPAPGLRPAPSGSTCSTDGAVADAYPQLPSIQTRAFMFDNPSYSPMAHANSPKVPSAATALAGPSSPTITLITDDAPVAAAAAAAAAPPNGPPSNTSRARSRLGNNNAGR